MPGPERVEWAENSAVCVSRDPCLEGKAGPFSREGTSVGYPACLPRLRQFLRICSAMSSALLSPVPTPPLLVQAGDPGLRQTNGCFILLWTVASGSDFLYIIVPLEIWGLRVLRPL